MCVISALLLSGVTLATCHYLQYQQLPSNGKTLGEILGITTTTNETVTDATFGLLTWQPYKDGCRPYTNPQDLSPEFQAARIAGMVATATALLATCLLLVELVCCRFCGSRMAICLLLVLGFLSQATTFLLYASDVCLDDSYRSYPCTIDDGTLTAIFATASFFLGAILSCPTPKPTPLIRTLLERERQSQHQDPCCYCFRRQTSNHKQYDDDSDEDDEDDEDVSDVEVVPPVKKQSSSVSLSRISEYESMRLYPSQVFAPSSMVRTSHVQASQTPFANAEIVEDDLFFDSKTI